MVMTLRYSSELEGLSIITWEQITANHIRQSILDADVDPPLVDLRVWTNIVKQTPVAGTRAVDAAAPSAAPAPSAEPTSQGVPRRHLQQDIPLKISFDTAVSFRSPKTNHSIIDMIGGAFDSDEDRDQYINLLKRTNDGAFQALEDIESVSVGGKFIPDEEDTDDGGGGRDMTMLIIIGAAAGGGALVLLMLFVVYRSVTTRKQDSTGGKTEAVSAVPTSNGNGVTT